MCAEKESIFSITSACDTNAYGKLWLRGTMLQDSTGLTWSDFGDPNNGMIGVMIIFAVEGVVFLVLAW